ncbi:MAG: (2Fe-2S)-binding protein [Syntrophobacteraceae bacterium]
MKISFTLNGKQTCIDTMPDRRVVDLLREDLGLTGAKEGCGAGECGACTILLNGESRLSCLMLAAQLDGCEITTIEGLSRNEDELHPIQEAFIQYGAVQCGFCTPGMILSAVDMLNRNPSPDRAEIREGLSGNLCRCTGYVKIVDAVEAASRAMNREDLPKNE